MAKSLHGGGLPQTVVLVHGLWMGGWAMALHARRLRRRGYRCLLFSYPSMRASLAENAQRLERAARNCAAPEIHFFGHSLGGLVILHLLARHPDLPVGRVVLAGSPCRGSLAARRLEASAAGRALLGRSMAEWLHRTEAERDGRCEIGVIAGSRGLGLGRLIAPLPAPHDGVVAVAETALAGARDSIVLPVSHSGMLFSREVTRQACAFFGNGSFLRE